MKTSFGWLAWVSLASVVGVGLTACDDPFESQSCTAIGCMDGVFMTFKTEDGSLAQGAYTFEFSIDGDIVPCEFSVPEDLPPRGALTDAQCGSGVSMLLGQQSECHEMQSGDSVSQSCDPIEGKWYLDVTIQGTPEQLEITARRDAVVLLQTTVDPEYQDVYPNGPECGGACTQSNLDLTLN